MHVYCFVLISKLTFVFILQRPLLLSSCIFAEDERSETVARSIIETIQDKANLLEGWCEMHESMYEPDSHDIPPKSEMGIEKASRAVVPRQDSLSLSSQDYDGRHPTID